jgi:VWFA-related protein
VSALALWPATSLDVRAQQQPAPSGPAPAAASFDPEPSARVVQIDAIVTDRQGKPLFDLQSKDFEVVENGVVQRLNAVELRRSTAAGSVTPIASETDEERAAREPGTRVFALLLDEFHVSSGENSNHVRDAVLRFLDTQVHPADLVAVLKPLDPVTHIRFARGADEARRAVSSFAGRKDDYEARTDFERRYIGTAPSAVRAARAQIVFSGLRALTLRLGELAAGRAAVVLVSEGFTPPRGRDNDLQGLVRASSRSRTALYAFDPSAAAAPTPEPNFLQSLATQTGGEFGIGAEALDAGLRKAALDLDGYYLLSYTSSHTGDGRFYDIQVRSRRSNTLVRSRSGYWAPVRTDLLVASDRRPSAPPRVIRRSPLIDTWFGLTVVDGVQYVTFTWTPAHTRAKVPIGTPNAVAIKVTTPKGAVLYEGELVEARASGPAEQPDAARFEATTGPIQIDLSVLAADGTQLDVAAQDIQVPDLSKKDPIILPPQIFRASNAREFRTLSTNPESAPVPDREFRRTERLLLRIPTYSASGADVSLDVIVVNRTGQALRTLAPMPGAADQLGAQFDLPLSWLAPGDYAIRLTATTRSGNTSELIRFRVTG